MNIKVAPFIVSEKTINILNMMYLLVLLYPFLASLNFCHLLSRLLMVLFQDQSLIRVHIRRKKSFSGRKDIRGIRVIILFFYSDKFSDDPLVPFCSESYAFKMYLSEIFGWIGKRKQCKYRSDHPEKIRP